MSARVLPKGWREVTLGSLGQIFDGPHATPTRGDEGAYFLNIASLDAGRLDLSKSDRVSKEDFATWTRRVQPMSGDLLFSYETRLGAAALMPSGVQACLGRRMALLRPDRRVVDPTFLLYAYLSPYFQALIEERTVHGATVDRIPLNAMSAWLMRLPDLSEQRAIAEVLGALDDKIAANETLSQILSQSIASEWQVLARRSPLGTLGDLVRLDYGKALPASVRQEGAVPVYGSGGIVGQHALGLVQGPAVIVGRKGTVGSVYWSEAPCFAIDTTFIAVPHAPHTLEYVHEALKSAPLAETNADSAVPGLNRMEAYATPIAIPNLQSETEFASKAAVLRRRALGAEQESRALTATRDALLPALMSGRLTVRDAEALAEEAGL